LFPSRILLAVIVHNRPLRRLARNGVVGSTDLASERIVADWENGRANDWGKVFQLDFLFGLEVRRQRFQPV
jgi:hypothetical protein